MLKFSIWCCPITNSLKTLLKFWHSTRKRWKSSTKLWAHFLNLEIIMMEWMHSTFGADKMWKTIDILTATEKAHRSLLCKTIKWSLGNGVSFAMLLNSFEPTLPRRIAEHITLSKICQLCGYSACRTWDNFIIVQLKEGILLQLRSASLG